MNVDPALYICSGNCSIVLDSCDSDTDESQTQVVDCSRLFLICKVIFMIVDTDGNENEAVTTIPIQQQVYT